MSRAAAGDFAHHWRTLVVIVALSMVAMTLLSPDSRPATAHADLERSNPAAGAVLPAAPGLVEVWFTEEVTTGGVTLTVLGPDGAQVDAGDTALDLFDPERKRVTVSLRPGLGGGGYTVRWETVSGADEDTATGEFAFTVEGAASAPCGVGSPVASPVAGTPESSPVAATPAASPVAAVTCPTA